MRLLLGQIVTLTPAATPLTASLTHKADGRYPNG